MKNKSVSERFERAEWIVSVGLAVADSVTLVTGIVQEWPDGVLFVLLGVLVAIVILFFMPKVVRAAIRARYVRRELTPAQRAMILSPGECSSGIGCYNDALESVGVKNDGKARLQRLDLEELGIITYEDGDITLTKLGDRVYAKLIQEEEAEG